MKQKQFTLNFEFNDQSEHSLNFVIPASDEKNFEQWLFDSLGDPQKNWLLIPESKRGCRTLLNTRNITKIEMFDTSHLLEENQQASKIEELSNV